MAERGKATALKRKQYKTSEARARAVILRRRGNWPNQLQDVPTTNRRFLPRLRRGGGQRG